LTKGREAGATDAKPGLPMREKFEENRSTTRGGKIRTSKRFPEEANPPKDLQKVRLIRRTIREKSTSAETASRVEKG